MTNPMTRERAARLLAAIAGKRALVFGDLILDRFVYGKVTRISREAPAPVLAESRRTEMLGGAGNLARNIAGLGGRSILVAPVGGDLEGQHAAALAAEACEARLAVEAERLTPTKSRYVAQGQQMFCVDRDPTGPVGASTEDALIAAFENALPLADVVLVSDYGRGAVTPRAVRALISMARAAGVPVSVDPRGSDYGRYDGASVIKPNADELAAETGLPVRDPESAAAALLALQARLPETGALLVTRGAGGMSLLERGRPVLHQSARPREVFDVSGAGDTALAALSLGLAAGVALSEAMAFADLAAGVAVGKPGTAVVAPEEILDDAAAGGDAPDWRIASREAGAELSARWRSQGLRVGFTNGCFDLLHPGHLAVLRFAASQCDRLFVGLNSDASVKRLKGPERPVTDEASRALMLASLEMVDRVVLFEEDTPEALIRALRPHVMIKGADYVADDLPGAAFMREIGGEVVLAPLMPGRSTTSIIQKLKG